MAGTTTRLGIGYPQAPGDAFHPAANIEAVAEALDGAAIFEQGAAGTMPSATSKPYGYWWADTATGARVWVNVGTGGGRAYRSLATGAEVDTHLADLAAHGNALGAANALGSQLQDGVVTGSVVSRLNSTTIRVAAGSAWITGLDGVRRYCTWAQTDITVPAAVTNPRIDFIRLPAPATHGAVVVPERVAALSPAESATWTTVDRAGSTLSAAGYLNLSARRVLTSGIGSTASTDAQDRRPWARGALSGLADSDSTEYNINGSIHTATVTQRIECTGAPLYIVAKVGGVRSPQSGAPTFEAWPLLSVDAATPTNATAGILNTGAGSSYGTKYVATDQEPAQSDDITIAGFYTPTAGSHLFSLSVAASTASGGAQYGWGPYELDIFERPQGLANNGIS